MPSDTPVVEEYTCPFCGDFISSSDDDAITAWIAHHIEFKWCRRR